MKAITYRQGRGLVFEELPDYQVGSDEVLVRVVNTGFCGSDHTLVESGGMVDGTILGHEVSGIVEDFGGVVKGVSPGTRVIIRPTFCGQCRECLMGKPYLCQVSRRSIGIGDLPGGFAEYVKVFPDMLIPIPENVDFLNGALAEVFATSLHAMNAVGQTRGAALVIGGGPIGLTLVNLLKLSGVSSVVLSEPTENRRRLGSHFGADWCVDPFEENFAEGMSKITEGRGFETVFECSGAEVSVRTALDAVRQGGKICVVSVILREVPIQPFMLNFKEVWMTGVYSNTHSENACCLAWMSEGKIDGRALISHLIDLEQLPDIYLSQIHTGKAVKVMIQTETSG